ncbi:hypothetical protein CORC01_10778 [Colletotrichum orchidophilum]|uniref:Aminoglycoside phosphotransferase domain-containing protein n=1 Tax=Colletotrichum orchidophilum TaxID=1209926 RepID=A0A1G4AXJ0_9PEZI|nr:uncharacterized protein CORC01_10778 [Colletotrichum orchidophilum]OHE93879.1 hypothetical protein CORC01_10778 [Colletotrichum orchidophilum]
MDISMYAADAEGIDALSIHQIANFFVQTSPVTKADCHSRAQSITGGEISPTLVQGETSYTVAADIVPPKAIQFRKSKLDLELLACARQIYGEFVPSCEQRGELGGLHVYEMEFVRGVALSRFQRQLFAPQMKYQLLRTVQDLARFFALAWINKPLPHRASHDAHELFVHYSSILDQLSRSLPERFQQKLGNVRQSLPLLFRHQYAMTINHDDLFEMNVHIDQETGQITGIVDWADAKIAPFGTSLWGLETLLGIQTASSWLFHPDHLYLRKEFWKIFYEVTGDMSEDDRQAVEIGRIFGLFRIYGFDIAPEKEGAKPLKEGDDGLVYLEALCLYSDREDHFQ